MNRWNLRLVALLCSAFMTALGFAACGDDDDEGARMTCEEAFSTFASDTCVNAALDTLPGVEDCLGDCVPPTDPACVEACFDLDDVLPASCVQANQILLDDGSCGQCFVGCGDAFLDCVVLGGDPEACLNELGLCANGCELP